MNKYNKLWQYVAKNCKCNLTLSFDEIKSICEIPIDHSFLKSKKELHDIGYKAFKISMKEQNVSFVKLPQNDTLVLYIHGNGGNPSESEHYISLFPNCDVRGLYYRSLLPWEAKAEFSEIFKYFSKAYKRIILIANSIGAYFVMNANIDSKVEKAYFISPVLDMQNLIEKMMLMANVTDKELERSGIIETEFGEILSWEYLCYAKKHRVSWKSDGNVLYGGKDNLTSRETVVSFAENNNLSLSIMEDGEHWFHTTEQMEFLDEWIKKSNSN